uniref:Calmodulin n=1 Tax=Mucochytrium quahogii TaxID=96639 RepID=A0A7S2W791_9STRA
MVDDMTQKINEAWVVANCSEGWSWSTPHSQQSVVNEKSVRYTWSSSKKFPLHWSIKERSAPCLKFEVKMQTSDGQMIRKTFQAVDLAGFVLCPGEELETWLLESDPAGFPGKLHVRLQFDTRKQKNLRDKKSLKAPSKGILNGRLHVHLRGGTKLVRPTNSSSPLCALLDVYSAGTSAQAAAMRSRIDEDGGSNPTWNEHFVSPVQVGNGMVPILNIIVQTAEREPIGLTSVPLFDSIFLDGHVLDARLPVRPWDEAAASQNKIGELGVSVQVLLDGSPTSTEDVSAAAPFVVTVLDGESFDYSGYDWNGQIEPAVQVVLNGSDERQTNAVSHDSRASPAWNRKLYFPSLPKNDRFTVSLLNDNTLSEECKVIACAHVQLRPLGTQSTQKQIAELKCPDSDSIVGKLHLSVEDTNLTLGGGCWQGTLSEQDRKQMELLQASAYIKVGVCRGRKFRDSIGRVHKAIVRLVCISKNSEPEKIIGETDLENDGLRKSQRIKEDRCFVWNHDFSFKRGDFNFASSKFLLRVIDCTMTGPMKDIGEVDISGMIKGMDGKGDVANDPAWVDLNPVTDNSEGIQPDKGCGSLQFHVDQIEPRRGLLSLKVKDVVGNLTSRSFALLGDNVSEFVKARVEPDGITARTKSNSLSDMLELEFSNCDENRDTLSVSLLCDDPDLIENVLGKCSLNIQRVIGAPNTWHTFMEPLSHAVTGKPLDCKVSCEVKLSTKRTTLDTSANPSTVSLPPVDANTEAIKCLTAKRLKSIFYKIDRDGSGTVSQDEFITAMHEDLDIVDILGSQVQNARKLFDDLDSNKDGELSWDEFQKVCVQQAELAGSSANASQGEGDHFFQAQVGGDEAFAPVGDGPQMETSRQPETQRSSSSSSGKSSRANTRKKPLRPGKRRKSFTRPIRTRDTQTFEKHDENMMARRDLDDPHELKAQIRALREEKRNVEEECRMLKLESRRSRGKNQRKISETNRLMSHALSGTTGPQPETSMTDDVRIELEKRLLLLEAENIALKERPDVFSATGGGDESFAPVQDDTPEHDTSTKVKLRQLELEKQQQQELHDKELEALRAENQRAQNELADIQERQEALEREAAEKASRLELEKQNTKKLHATLNELNFERMQYAPIDGDDKAGRNRYRLVQMMALEAEQTRLLEDARSKRKEQNAAAARLQSAIRGCKDRAKFKEAKATRSFAAVVLQASYRARKAKQNYDSEREQVSGASRSIQAAYRGRLARKDLAYKQKAAARIQGGFRGRKDREKVDKLKRERASALAIQRQLRRRKSTKAVHQLRTQKQKETDAAILLQSHVRANQGRHSFNLKKDKWEQEQKEERSATSIQKIVRRKQARRDVKKAEQLKRGNHSAAYKIQKNVRKRMQGRSPVMLRTHSRPRVSKDENSYTDLNNATARLIQHLSQSRHRDASIEKAKDTLAGALHDISNSNTN